MSTVSGGRVRAATAADAEQLVDLWAELFPEDSDASGLNWRPHAHEVVPGRVEASDTAYFPVVDLDGEVVATAVGTLDLGVPNPYCARGRAVRMANVVTLPQHRGRGYGTLLVRHVVEWARSIAADRVDLSATSAGQRLYERVGFQATRAPRVGGARGRCRGARAATVNKGETGGPSLIVRRAAPGSVYGRRRGHHWTAACPPPDVRQISVDRGLAST